MFDPSITTSVSTPSAGSLISVTASSTVRAAPALAGPLEDGPGRPVLVVLDELVQDVVLVGWAIRFATVVAVSSCGSSRSQPYTPMLWNGGPDGGTADPAPRSQ